LIGKIVKALPYEMLKIKYDGVLDGGQEYYGEGDVADFMNAVETYSLTEKDGVTILYIDSPMNEEYFDFMSLAWDKALLKIKELAEKKALDL
jgi:hypothetical protein